MRIEFGKYDICLFCTKSVDAVGKHIILGVTLLTYKKELLIKRLYAYKITVTTMKKLYMQVYKRKQVQQKLV
jgi:hypothetical protein